MKELEIQINQVLKELEELINNNSKKEIIETKRKKLDKLLKEYLRDMN